MVIRLPLRLFEENSTTNNSHVYTSGGITAEKILIFEDDPSLGNMLREYLTSGMQVKLCSDRAM